jgi:DICT domain-containing protein
VTPFGLVARAEPPVAATKRELVRLARELEREALQSRPPAVGAALQDARHLTERTRRVYARLAEAGAAVRLQARGLQSWLAPGVTGVALGDDDPLVDEWVIVVVGAAPVAFAATDLHSVGCEDDERCFRYAVSHDRELAHACAELLGLEQPGVLTSAATAPGPACPPPRSA